MNNVGIAGKDYCRKTIVGDVTKVQNHLSLIIHRSLVVLYFFKAGLQDRENPFKTILLSIYLYHLYFLLYEMVRVQSIVGQKIAIYNKDKKILILRRSATSNGAWNWDLPGWWILLNETPIECLKREIAEETWLDDVIDIHPIHIAAKTFSDGSHSFFVWYMWMLNTDQEVVLSHEHDEYLWVDPNDVEKYTLQSYREETVKKSFT